MASRVHSLEPVAWHSSRVPAPAPAKTASVTAVGTSQPPAPQTPSFTAVFAQIAASAAAAGTTVASTAPSGAAQPAVASSLRPAPAALSQGGRIGQDKGPEGQEGGASLHASLSGGVVAGERAAGCGCGGSKGATTPGNNPAAAGRFRGDPALTSPSH